MCGICGKLTFDGAPGDRALIHRMSETILHRGPDDEGCYVAAGIGLGERRLSIIDLRAIATAPLPNEDGTIWLVYNGEIYNYVELREKLLRAGHTFRTETDSEVIVHLYEEYGTACVDHLRGMFAFAIWDAPRQRLFAARDRLGKKPFVYARTRDAFLFGSAISAILADPAVSREPDYDALDVYLTLQYVPSPRTAFRGINKLPPGHRLVCTAAGELTVEPYWQPPASAPSTAPVDEIKAELLERLADSVRLRMRSDVPLGAFLSGGVDSGAVVALMAQQSAQPIKTFSIGFTDQSFNELPYAKLVAERYGTDHHEMVIEPDAAAVLPRLVELYCEPFADSSALPSYYVSKAGREHVTVALTGDGGDESFSGYHNYGSVARWMAADRLPRPARRALASAVSAVVSRLPYDNRTARVERAFAMLGGDVPDRHRLIATIMKPQEKRAAYTAHFESLIEDESAGLPAAELEWKAGDDAIAWMQRHDQAFYLADCLMVKMDVASMANSLEVRCPLLDHTFVEFAATIPSELKRDATGGKLILRDALRDLLPAATLEKRKTGFGIPLARWLRTDLAELVRANLLDERARRRNLFDPQFVARIVDEHMRGKRDWSSRLWALLFLELWFREFID